MKIKDHVPPKAPPLEPGLYFAVLIGVVDLGEQYSEAFKKYSRKVQLVFEIPSETVEVDGKAEPRQLSRAFTFASGRKGKLREFLSGWHGSDFSDEEFGELDLFDLIGHSAALNVVLSEDRQYSNISTASKLPKGMPAITTATTPIRWDMDEWTDEGFAALPQWAQEKISASTQYKKDHVPTDALTVQPPNAEAAIDPLPNEEAPF